MITSIQTGLPFNTLTNPYPNGFLRPANGSQGLLTGIGTNISSVNPDFVVPYADQWMAGVNIELPGNIGVDLAYVGNEVSKLPTDNNTELNAIPLSEQQKAIERLGGNASYLSTLVPNPFSGLVNPILALNNPTINRGQLLRPFPQFATQVRETLDNKGWSKYHAFEMAAQRRFSNGFTASVNYTLSRLRQAVDYLNNGFESRPFEDLANIDRTHHVTITALYELPLGPGRTIGRSTTGLAAALIGGWQFNLLHEYESGTPTAMPNGQLKASCDPRLPSGQQSRDKWFDTSCFQRTADATGTFGNTGRNAVRGPGAFNIDASVIKHTKVGPVDSELRLEVFNLLNHPQFGQPNGQLGNAAFGTITTMLASSSCAFCGTTERQVQLAVKVKF